MTDTEGMGPAAKSAELLQRHRKGRRLDRVALGIIVMAAVATLFAAWVVLDTVNQNTRDRKQDEQIERAIGSDPCSSLSRLATRPGLADPGQLHRLTVQCRDFLDGLAQDAVFSHALACYIVHRAKLTSPECDRVLRRGELQREGSGRSPPSGSESQGAGSPLPPTLGLGPSPGSSQGPGAAPGSSGSPPDTPAAGGSGSSPPAPGPGGTGPPPGQPPKPGMGASVCVENPLLPACVNLSLP